MTTVSTETLHASCVAIQGRAVLIEGRPGMGKSDLALRLIDRGAVLVSDDYTVLTRRRTQLIASAPARIAGKIEVRGLGIVEMPHITEAPVALIVSLAEDVERLPLDQPVRKLAGIEVPVIMLQSLFASAPIKVEMALVRFGRST